MQNMEKFYGFHVTVDSKLDPYLIESLRENAKNIMYAHNYNDEEYFVYYHQLIIEPKDKHFNFEGDLSERLEKVDLVFSVNLKQKKYGDIKLYNYMLNQNINNDIKCISNTYEIKYIISGKFLLENLGFKNEIVTFIRKKVLPRHRKIKVSLIAYPTNNFIKVLKNKTSSHLTQLDIKFEKPISLGIPHNKYNKLKNKNKKRKHKIKKIKKGVIVMQKGNTYIVNGQAGAVGNNAQSINTTNQQNIIKDITKLHEQLVALRSIMKKESNTIEEDKAIVEIGNAIEYTKQSNITKAIEHLKKAGSKALEWSERIGVSLVSSILKDELGL